MIHLAWLVGAAWATPGYVATEPGATATSDLSHVVISVQGQSSVVTVWSALEGDFTSAALLLPVPGLQSTGTRIFSPNAVSALDTFTAPRRVDLTCADTIRWHRGVSQGAGCVMAAGCAGDRIQAGFGPGPTAFSDAWLDTPVDLVQGDYSLERFEAGESEALFEWLDDLGLEVEAAAEEALAAHPVVALHVTRAPGYLGGRWVNAVRFTLDHPGDDPSPALRYLNGDAIVYVADIITWAVADLPESPSPEGPCLATVEPDEPFDAWYEREVLAELGTPGWTTEYRGRLECEVCTLTSRVPRFATSDLSIFGNVFVTRLRVRAADQPLRLVPQGRRPTQVALIPHRRELESQFPDCVDGFGADPGECPADAVGRPPSCRVVPHPASWLGAVLGVLLWRRRRR